jgi:hypothetical protein
MFERRELPGALEHCRAAIRLGMTDPVLFRIAGFSSYFLGDLKDAVTQFERYLASSRGDDRVRLLLGGIRKRLDGMASGVAASGRVSPDSVKGP